VFAASYGWGGAIDELQLLDALTTAARALGKTPWLSDQAGVLESAWDPAVLVGDDPPLPVRIALLDQLSASGTEPDLLIERASIGIGVIPIPDHTLTGPVIGVALILDAEGDTSGQLELAENVVLEAFADANAAVRVALRPGATEIHTASGAAANAAATLKLSATPAAGWLLGDRQGTRLEIDALTLTGAAEAAAGGSARVALEVRGLACLDLSAADGFLTSTLGSSVIQTPVHGGLAWSSAGGLSLMGGAGLAGQIGLNTDIGGVLKLSMLRAEVAPRDSGASLNLGLTGSLTLGPVTVTVDGIGLGLGVQPTTGSAQPGNLGILDIAFALQPPRGLGLSITAPAVAGGGFLEHDESRHEYLGAAELELIGLAVEAVGVVTAGAGSGYSMAVLAAARFRPPVEIGFGFAIQGLGGLVGVNRTINVTALQQLTRTGSLQDLMFPADLQNNATRVLGELDECFPAAQGQFVVGPAIELVWGTGGFLTAELAVLIELPAPLRAALLGVGHLGIPDPAAPIVDITLDCLGVADVTAKRLEIDAALRHSKIAGFTLTGQAALRASWGQQPGFALAVGGFNPHFKPPASFPPLERLTLSLGGSNPRLVFSSYFAVTSNTLQFGSAGELYASAGPAAFRAYVAFDALVQFDPFGVQLDLTISAEVLLGGSSLCSLTLDLHVSGPSPWHINGSVHFSILFFSFTVPVSLTVGETAPLRAAAPPPTLDQLAATLSAELEKASNWQTAPSAGAGIVVLRPLQTKHEMLVHPLGTLAVRQRILPLQHPIGQIGGSALGGQTTLTIEQVELDRQVQQARAVDDFFAPAQYTSLNEAQALEAPSFESMQAGVGFGPTGLAIPADASQDAVQVPALADWTTIVLDAPAVVASAAALSTQGQVDDRPVPHGLTRTRTTGVNPPSALLATQLEGAAAALNGARGRAAAFYASEKTSGIAVTEPRYSVVPRGQLSLPDETGRLTAIGSYAQARTLAESRPGRRVIFESELLKGQPTTDR
jgi:hypothetical protein